MKKIYKICSDLDYEKVALATLKKVYSTTLFPRVLLNIQNMVLLKNLKKTLILSVFLRKIHEFLQKKFILIVLTLEFSFSKSKKKHT